MTLILGFGVADVTGVRALGGVVLVLGCGWCALLRWRQRSLRTAISLTAVFLVAFAVSHPLGKAIGAWPSVLVVSAAVALITYVVFDRQPSRESHEVG
jgi:hypothetical protein